MSPRKLAKLTRRNRTIATEHGMYVTVEYLLWRDQLRRWKWVMDSYGSYVHVEDK